MDFKLMTPAQVWQDYDAESLALNSYLNEEFKEEALIHFSYTFTALSASDGSLRATVKVIKRESPGGRAILIVQEYDKRVQKKIVKDLAGRGYTVIIPDCSGIDSKFKSQFPPSLSYGNIAEAGEHIKTVCPSAKDTSQYLYSIITKRTITFINKELSISDIMIMGVGDGVEIAMQVAGSDNRLSGLVCINGAGYKEYSNLNKYGSKSELTIDHQMMCWLTGVASVAYAKHISVPVFIAISSNGRQADIDRLPNLLALLQDNQATIVITPRSRDSISYISYHSAVKWMEEVFNGNITVSSPEISISVSEGLLYAEVNADSSGDIKEVFVYYACGEYDHLVRNWQKVSCEVIGTGQFLAKLDISETDVPLFAFAQVVYNDGFVLSSPEDYLELKGYEVKKTIEKNSRIVYEGSMGLGTFSEEAEKAVLLQNGLSVSTTPIGLKGIQSSFGEMISYEIGAVGRQSSGKILQVDAYSNGDVLLQVKLVNKKGDCVEEYTACSNMISTSGAFISHRFSPNDFKNASFMPLEGWEDVKAIKISNQGVIIGKILFI